MKRLIRALKRLFKRKSGTIRNVRVGMPGLARKIRKEHEK